MKLSLQKENWNQQQFTSTGTMWIRVAYLGNMRFIARCNTKDFLLYHEHTFDCARTSDLWWYSELGRVFNLDSGRRKLLTRFVFARCRLQHFVGIRIRTPLYKHHNHRRVTVQWTPSWVSTRQRQLPSSPKVLGSLWTHRQLHSSRTHRFDHISFE